MSRPYDAEHERIRERLDRNETRLNRHGEVLDELRENYAKSSTQIKYLCKEIASLVSTLKWGITFIIGVLVSFLIWYIQNIG